jgi:hypothetical protein
MTRAPSVPSPARRFPVVWRDGDGETASAAGELIVERDVVRFEGSRAGELADAQVRFADVRDVRIARSAPERKGRPTIVLDRDSTPLYVEPIGAGLLGEIASLLTALREEGARRSDHVAVVLPLRAGMEQRVLELVDSGPPFKLEGRGIVTHQVYVGGREAIFVFGGPDVRGVLERVVGDPALWRAGLAWRDAMAGRPRVLECAFSWAAPVAGDT